MQPHLLTCLLLLLLIPLLTSRASLVTGRCREDQQSLLLQLKGELNFNHSSSQKLARWNESTACCEWPGIRCDSGGLGRVIGLNLSMEYINGGGGLADSSALFGLRYLEDLALSYNYFGTTIPSALSNLTNLRYLDLYSAGFRGQVPIEISQLTSLISLNLSYQYEDRQSLKLEKPNLALLVQNLTQLTDLRLSQVDLSAQGNEWSQVLSSSLPGLKVLMVSNCSLPRPIDRSLSKLHSISILELNFNNFSSPLADFFTNFRNLTTLRMTSCGLTGTLPPNLLQNLTQLEYLDFSSNDLIGPIPTHWESCQKLVEVHLRGNALNGIIPPALFAIPSLVLIDLSFNQLGGHVPEFPNVAFPVLKFLELSSNRLEGSIPRSIFELESLECLGLSDNIFNGSVQLSWIQKLQNLKHLSLSANNLTVEASAGNNSSSLSIFPELVTLGLGSCNLNIFPELGNQSRISAVDLWDNNITGVVPHWIMESTTLQHLNLSDNSLVGFPVQPVSFPNLQCLDMHGNQLQGDFPVIPSPSLFYLDYSHNLFNGSLSPKIFINLSASFFSVSNNSLQGAIPTSICNATYLQVVDLSNNHLNGTIPSCLLKGMAWLSVLDMSGNQLSGDIPDTFQASCLLHTLDLNNNQLQGRIPKSLGRCRTLEVLDLGNNKIADVFPCFRGIMPTLRVLILRNNVFNGSNWCLNDRRATWKQLQIVDLAFNNFTGPLDAIFLATWEAMMREDGWDMEDDHLKFGARKGNYYQNSIIMTTKGRKIKFEKILKVLKCIDFSSNKFDGPIPEVIGEFKALWGLNLSYNAFTSQIPSVLGKLSNLESLDLSNNKLSGEIPMELTRLTFLSRMNLSDNRLIGKIPTGSQFQTFDNTSYGGNSGLCGAPLSKNCTLSPPAPATVIVDHGAEIDWDFLSKAFGYVFGLAVVMLPAALWPSFRLWYWPKIDFLLIWMFPNLYVKDWNNRLRQRQRQRRSLSRPRGRQ